MKQLDKIKQLIAPALEIDDLYTLSGFINQRIIDVEFRNKNKIKNRSR